MATPDFRVIADTVDITNAIRQGLLSLRVTDEAGINSDKVEIKLDDRGSKIKMPNTGAELEIFLGYKEDSLVRMGLFIVDEVSVESPPQSMIIRARAADMRQVLKAPRTKTWGAVTLNDVLADIAGQHGLNARISPELASIAYDNLVQSQESDLHLLTRLAREHGAITKPVHGNLLFVPKGEAKSVSGQLIPPVTIHEKQITSWSATFADREKFGSVQAEYHDKALAEKVKVTAGDGDPVFTLRHTYDTLELAMQNAKSKLERLRRGTGAVNITLPGNTRFIAEGKINLVGVRAGVDGQWVLTRVEHSFSGSGYQCRLDGETPKN